MAVETFEKRLGGGERRDSLLLLNTWKREGTYIDPETKLEQMSRNDREGDLGFK